MVLVDNLQPVIRSVLLDAVVGGNAGVLVLGVLGDFVELAELLALLAAKGLLGLLNARCEDLRRHLQTLSSLGINCGVDGGKVVADAEYILAERQVAL